MIQALYSAAGAMKSQQTNLDIIADNVSNVNTVGFKATRVDFKDAIYQAMLSPVNNDPDQNHQLGHGVHVAQTARLFTQGAFNDTENPLDFAIVGEGFFALQSAMGEVQYTRAGNFSVSVEQDGNFLVASDGSHVLADDGNRIALPNGVAFPEITEDGRVLANGTDLGIKIAICTFPNAEGLLGVGQTRFIPSENSGDPALFNGARLRQGVLEISNSTLSEEFSRLIKMQRAYQLASRALKTSDDMEGIANNIRA